MFVPQWVPPEKFRPASAEYRQYRSAFHTSLVANGVPPETAAPFAGSTTETDLNAVALAEVETQPEWKLPKRFKKSPIRPLPCHDRAYERAYEGILEAVAGADVNAGDEAGNTVLHYVVRNFLDYPEDDLEVLRSLCAVPGLRCDIPNKCGIPAAALAMHSPALLAELVGRFGAEFANSRRGDVPLLVDAVQGGQREALKILCGVPGVQVNAVGPAGTALHTAIRQGNAEDVTLLLGVPGLDVNCGDAAGATALHVAIEMCNSPDRLDLLRLLLNTPGIDINRADAAGQTPIFRLPAGVRASSGQWALQVLRLLRDMGADVAVRDRAGGTVLHETCARATTAIATRPEGWAYALVDCLAGDIDPNACRQPPAPGSGRAPTKPVPGQSPAHCIPPPADRTGPTEGVHVSFVSLLLDRGADFSVADHDGNVPWHTVLISEYDAAPEQLDAVLFAMTPALGIRNLKKQTPMHTQQLHLLPRMAKAGGGQYINVQDAAGDTPTHRILTDWLREDPHCNNWLRVLKVLKRLPDNLSRKIRNKQNRSVADILLGTCERRRFEEWLDSGIAGPLNKKPRLE